MIGAGGVATVCAFKIAQNTDVFGELMIASHHKEKCDRLVDAIHAKGYKMDIKTAEVDADSVEQLTELFNSCPPGTYFMEAWDVYKDGVFQYTEYSIYVS